MDSTGAVHGISALFKEMTAAIERGKTELEILKERIFKAKQGLQTLQRAQ